MTKYTYYMVFLAYMVEHNRIYGFPNLLVCTVLLSSTNNIFELCISDVLNSCLYFVSGVC